MSDMEAFGPAPPMAGPAQEMTALAEQVRRDVAGCSSFLNPVKGLDGMYRTLIDLATCLRDEIRRRAAPAIDTIYLDLDGVLSNFVEAALKKHQMGYNVLLPGQYAMWEGMGISQAMFWDKCKGNFFWEELGWMPDGHAILDAVRQTKRPFWLLSSPSDDPGSCSGKYAWVAKHLPELRRRLILCPDKRAVARPGALLLDDSDSNIEKWCFPNHPQSAEGGGSGLLVPRNWNSLHRYQNAALDYVQTNLKNIQQRGTL